MTQNRSRYRKGLLDLSKSMYPAEGLIRVIRGKYPNLGSVPSSGRALDAGAGDGRNAFFLHQEGFEVFAFEVDEKIVEKLSIEYPEVKSCLATNSATPYQSNFFDLVVSWQALYYLDDDINGSVENNIREIARILKPGGTLISCIPTKENFIYKKSLLIKKDKAIEYRKLDDYFRQRDGVVLGCFTSEDSYKDLLNEYGITETRFGFMHGDWFGLSYSWFVAISKKNLNA